MITILKISGSLGDLGTLLPIMMSLSLSGQINLTSTLWFTGIWNIFSGLMFQVPVCVQPMKAIAAVVMTKNMDIQENMSAGLAVAMFVFFLGITRTVYLVGSYTPPAIVKGLQLGTAIQLILKAQKMVPTLGWAVDRSNWSDNNVWVLLSFIFVVACYRTRIPSALILFFIGLIFALVYMYATAAGKNLPRPSVIGGHYPDSIIIPSPEQFKNGLLNAGLGQLPLTLLNSVIALSALIEELFPKKHANSSNIAMSVGVMNLIGCWFGAMPVCHGSGGLAGQYRFGARSEVSVVFLGLCKLILGILFGASLVGLLEAFPKSILAVMLFISGVELGCAAKSVSDIHEDEFRKREDFVVMLLTTGSLVAYSNDGIGFCTGLVSAALLSIQRLGLKTWFRNVTNSIKSIPYVWTHQTFKPLEIPIAQRMETSEEGISVASNHKQTLYGSQPSEPSNQSLSSINISNTQTFTKK
ncbi:hypothetical protein BDF20DRAFT_819095 [Mycotypha africana]|uniref:uncharacterized protein n=1 Tax=Mycotypha africana TaxID=64632 RepID=UPI0022FFE2AC|nr:uncharacterized protein BDF20DRAFT_819095 [Mycotypha africana]KAI8979433.1 hypothetical protein BDF20DRAFT_819095 [Mycotypha africana]